MKPNKNQNGKKSNDKKSKIRWALTISMWTFILAFLLSILSESLMKAINLVFAIILLLVIILIGIIFDIIGTAVTAADQTPFHSMCSKKVPGAKHAVNMIKKADRVSNFCNDVIGDICGIVSGAASATIVYKILLENPDLHTTFISILLTSIAASLTVGGKAFGKNFAIKNSGKIVYSVAYMIYIIRRIFRKEN
ncbi:MAG: hypothetical protein PHP06_01260 [Clostridia bacterium]|nr:hypothetical protein [Clostridia bacterium]